jgi:two-component system response regulator YesN
MPDKILLVDDDREFRKEFRESLSEYAVIEASDGDEALRLLKKPNGISLVILDIKMPGPSGTEVLRTMKEMDPGLGIIILTGCSTESTAIEALKAHADDYIEKPFDLNKTKEAIEKLLEARRKARGLPAPDASDKIACVKDFLDRNCCKRVLLEDAAKVVSLCPKYLSRLFMQVAGVNFNDYRLKAKIEKAKELIAEGYNTNEMTAKLSYENPESFIRQFKKFTGCTPSEYRKNRQGLKRAK